MGVYLYASRLPSEYQEVEYIQSSGTQYIDTGLAPSNNTKVQFKLSNYSINSSIQYVFGSTSNWGNKMFGLLGTTSWSGDTINGHLLYGTSEYKLSSGNIGNGGTHTGELSSNGFYVDGTRIRTVSGTFTGTINMTIFAGNINGIIGANERGSFKLYYFKVYESGTLVRDFIPCYRKSDSVIGLYDLVNSQFYTNSGTGTFSKGADVTAIPLKNAYIGEVYEYSYDFRGKTISGIQNDGWNIFVGSNLATVNSYGIGITSGNTGELFAKIDKSGILNNAKKLTIKMDSTLVGSSACRLSFHSVVTSSSKQGVTGNRYAYNSYSTSIYGTSYFDSYSLSGEAIMTTIVDLVGKTWTTTSSKGYTRSGTLTDTEVSNIRDNITGFYINVSIASTSASGGIGSIYLLVEK